MVQTPERVGEGTREVERRVEELPEARLLPPPHKKNRTRWIVAAVAAIGAAVIALIAVLVFAGGDSTESDRGGAATNQEAVDDGGAAGGGAPQIQTASGTFTIADVVEGDRYPKGCADTDTSCNVAMAGYKILVVKLAPEGTADVEDIMSEGSEAYITASDGARTESFIYGWSLTPDDTKEGMVGFTPEVTGEGFTLHWPGNDPVELGS